MMTPTHIAFSVSLTSIVLATANPVILVTAGIASLFPDIDTSKSFIGRLLCPLSRYLESQTVHRGITHSFFASGLVTICAYPLVVYGYTEIWYGLIIGYFFGWFGDVFTKSGVEAFYPSHARLIIPRNPRLRLGTRSNGEWFLLMVLVAIAVLSININTKGGIIRGFTQTLGIPSGAIETIQTESSLYLLNVEVKGRNTLTEEPVNATYEVIEPLTANDLLVKDKEGNYYKVGSSQESQIQASQIRVKRIAPIKTEISQLTFNDEDIDYQLLELPQERTYLTGTLTIHDGDDLILPSHVERFDTITLQPGEIAYARLISANPHQVAALLGDYYISGSLIVRHIAVTDEQ
jgi:inner membrane protein